MPERVQVAIEDTGPGLDPAIVQRIFNPFFTANLDGLDLGLSISRSIIGAHVGHLWATPRAARHRVPLHHSCLRFGLADFCSAAGERSELIFLCQSRELFPLRDAETDGGQALKSYLDGFAMGLERGLQPGSEAHFVGTWAMGLLAGS